jgi:hypothetical protein
MENNTLLLKSICDRKKDGHAIKKADAYITVNNRKFLRKTTKGWLLCVEWKDSSTTTGAFRMDLQALFSVYNGGAQTVENNIHDAPL